MESTPDHVCRCGCVGVARLTPSITHYGYPWCPECDAEIRDRENRRIWLKKPDSDRSKYRRPNSHRDLVAKFSRGYCELCLRSRDDLGPNETFNGHHVVEYSDGGTSDRENVWILCSACHSHVNWMRRYVGRNSPEGAA